MAIRTLKDLLAQELRALLAIEAEVASVLPKLKRIVSTNELTEAILDHTEKTKQYVAQLRRFVKQIGRDDADAPEEEAAKAILHACSIVEQSSPKGNLRDAALLVVLQRLEHYRFAVYTSTLALAKQLGEDEVLQLLKEGAVQDDLTAKRFAQIAIQVNAEAFIDTHSERCKPTIKG